MPTDERPTVLRVPFPLVEGNETTIAVLERMLNDARAGRILGLFAITKWDDGTHCTTIGGHMRVNDTIAHLFRAATELTMENVTEYDAYNEGAPGDDDPSDPPQGE